MKCKNHEHSDMDIIEQTIERYFNKPQLVQCWKCSEVNSIRADLVQFECERCDTTNYAKDGRWPNYPYPEVSGLGDA